MRFPRFGSSVPAARLESLPGAHHQVAALRVDEMREREAHAQLRREQAAVIRRAEQPEFRREMGRNAGPGLDAHLAVGMVVGQGVVEVADQLPDLLRKLLGVGKVAAAHGARGALVAARRAADAEVDAARVQGFQHAENFSNLEGAVVGQQHAAGAHPDPPGLRAEAREQDFGAGIGKRRDGVMLGEPVAVKAQLVGAARERERLGDCLRRAVTRNDGRLVEDGELHRGGARARAELGAGEGPVAQQERRSPPPPATARPARRSPRRCRSGRRGGP